LRRFNKLQIGTQFIRGRLGVPLVLDSCGDSLLGVPAAFAFC
jgi:hypothetical protein